jgi:hypothetical protein
VSMKLVYPALHAFLSLTDNLLHYPIRKKPTWKAA